MISRKLPGKSWSSWRYALGYRVMQHISLCEQVTRERNPFASEKIVGRANFLFIEINTGRMA